MSVLHWQQFGKAFFVAECGAVRRERKTAKRKKLKLRNAYKSSS